MCWACSGQSTGHPWTAALIIPMGLCAFGGGAAALFAIVLCDERSAVALLPLMAGALALYLVSGELISPH